MMAPRKKASPTPDEQVAGVQAQRVALAVELSTTRSEMERAYDALGIAEPLGPNERGQATVRPLPEGQLSIVERRQAAEEAQALGRDREPFEAIAKDEADLGVTIRVNRPRIAALEGAVKTLAAEIEALEARHRDYFVMVAEEGSRGGEEQLDKLIAMFDETQAVLGDMWGRWTRVGVPVATDDLGDLRGRLLAVKRECCWPGESEARYRESLQRRAREAADAGGGVTPSESGRRVIGSSAPKRDPLIELI
jgi:hypothetical protein